MRVRTACGSGRLIAELGCLRLLTINRPLPQAVLTYAHNTKSEMDDVILRAKLIKLLLMDCDGVMTDGRIMLLENGDEQKTFNVRDGHGIVLFHRAGLKTGIISGRSSSFVQKRAWELGMPQEFIWQ